MKKRLYTRRYHAQVAYAREFKIDPFTPATSTAVDWALIRAINALLVSSVNTVEVRRLVGFASSHYGLERMSQMSMAVGRMR